MAHTLVPPIFSQFSRISAIFKVYLNAKHLVYRNISIECANNFKVFCYSIIQYVSMWLFTQDDINTIPFFEVKLPRELALLIFRHLDMIDLCTCAQVCC